MRQSAFPLECDNLRSACLCLLKRLFSLADNFTHTLSLSLSLSLARERERGEGDRAAARARDLASCGGELDGRGGELDDRDGELDVRDGGLIRARARWADSRWLACNR